LRLVLVGVCLPFVRISFSPLSPFFFFFPFSFWPQSRVWSKDSWEESLYNSSSCPFLPQWRLSLSLAPLPFSFFFFYFLCRWMSKQLRPMPQRFRSSLQRVSFLRQRYSGSFFSPLFFLLPVSFIAQGVGSQKSYSPFFPPFRGETPLPVSSFPSFFSSLSFARPQTPRRGEEEGQQTPSCSLHRFLSPPPHTRVFYSPPFFFFSYARSQDRRIVEKKALPLSFQDTFLVPRPFLFSLFLAPPQGWVASISVRSVLSTSFVFSFPFFFLSSFASRGST